MWNTIFDDGDELFSEMIDQQMPDGMLTIDTVANLTIAIIQKTTSKIWTCMEATLRLN